MLALLERIGARTTRRPRPRFGVTLAGAGCALMVVGVVVIGGDHTEISDDGGSNTLVGVLLSALVIAAGYITLNAVRTGALATAGVVASALGVPPFMIFLTFSTTGEPVNIEAVLIVSAVVWFASYCVGPGRGHAFYLAAGLVAVWLFFIEQLESGLSVFLFFPLTFTLSPLEQASEPPNLTTVGFVSLALGVGYFVTGRWLDRQGYEGAGTPFVFAGHPALFGGILLLIDDLEAVGTGLFLTGFGLALIALGAMAGRRATAWIGGLSVFVGLVVILVDLTDDNVSAFGLGAIALGLLAVVAAQLLSTSEPDEMTAVLTEF